MKQKTITEWKISTPTGWSDFSGISIVNKNSSAVVNFTSGRRIHCSTHHLLKSIDGNFYFAQDLSANDSIVSEDTSPMLVSNVEFIDGEISLFDVNNVFLDSEFFANGVLNHNCNFIDEAEAIWLSAQPTLSTGGRSVILSTPEGVGSFFHRTWIEAEAGRNGFVPIKLKWDLHPDRDHLWRSKQTLELGVRKSAQEFDCEFGASGNTVIANDIINKYETKVKLPIEKRGPSGNLHVWKNAEEGRKYMVVADVGRGDAEDYSACHVIDIENVEQVAEFEHKLDPKSYGNFLVVLATEYNDALLIIENNNIGYGTVQQAIDRNYKNLFYMTSDMKYVNVEEQITNKLYSEEKKMTPGFLTSSRTRPLMISKFDLYIQQNEVTINSLRLINQMRTFIWHNGKAQAANGYNDDLIMAMAIALWVRDTALRLETQSVQLTGAMINHIGSSHSRGLIPASTNGAGGVYRAVGSPIRDPWSMRLGGINEDLKWLIK